MKVIFVLALALLLSPIAIFAQATSGVTGVVKDPAGAIVPGVTVTLTDTRTDRTFTTTTNDQGSYTFTNVEPSAAYRLTFTGQGFQTLTVNAVTLGVAKIETYDATLTAGNVSASALSRLTIRPTAS